MRRRESGVRRAGVVQNAPGGSTGKADSRLRNDPQSPPRAAGLVRLAHSDSGSARSATDHGVNVSQRPCVDKRRELFPATCRK